MHCGVIKGQNGGHDACMQGGAGPPCKQIPSLTDGDETDDGETRLDAVQHSRTGFLKSYIVPRKVCFEGLLLSDSWKRASEPL